MKRSIFLLIGILLVSCGKETMTYDTDVSTPIVEGYLTTGASSLTVKVYTMESFDENNIALSKPVKNLELYVNDIKLTETADGTYTLISADGILNEGNTCNLRFEYNNKTITASTTMPAHPQNLQISNSDIFLGSSSGLYWSDSIPDVKITWNNTDNDYYQVYIRSPDNSESVPLFGGERFGKMMMQPFQGNSYQLQRRDMMSTGRYVCYLYKVNKDYVELYERISSSDLANPVSYITNGLGIFTGMSADTIPYRVDETSDLLK